jgi:hypothetical protein
LTAECRPNAAETQNHTEIICGNIVMTASAVRNRSEVVRHADFRLQLARDQRLWWQEAEPSPEAKLFSMLLYGMADARTPAFADIAFLAQNGKSYVGGRICLFEERFAELVAAKRSFTEEIVPDEVEPRLRDDIPKASDDE